MGILHKAPGSTNIMKNQHHKGGSVATDKSARVHVAVGSGSRPTKSHVPIHTTSPHHAHKLDSRHVPGALGQGKMK